MLVKYNLGIFKGKKNIIFMFTMDHDIEYVENFVGGLYHVKQCRGIRPINGVSVCDSLEGKYYDCNSIFKLGPKFTCANRRFGIIGDSFTMEFQIDDNNLYKMDYEEFVMTMKERHDYLIKLVFCSSEDKHTKARYVGDVGLIDIQFE